MVNSFWLTRQGAQVRNNRTFKNSPDYSEPSKFKVSISTPNVAWSDTSLVTTVPIAGSEMVDGCSNVTGWTASGTNSVTVNSSVFKPDSGTDGALNVVKSDTSSALFSVSKTVTSLTATSKDLLVWFYVKDSTALGKFKSSGTAVVIRYGSGASDYWYKDYEDSDFVVGWNFLKLGVTSGFTGSTGSPDMANADYFYLSVECNNATDTFVAGDVVFDSIRLGSSDDYLKAFDSTSFDETDASVSGVCKLSVSDANGFLLDGFGVFNEDVSEKLVLKAKFTGFSKSSSDLLKFTFKLKSRNIGQV